MASLQSRTCRGDRRGTVRGPRGPARQEGCGGPRRLLVAGTRSAQLQTVPSRRPESPSPPTPSVSGAACSPRPTRRLVALVRAEISEGFITSVELARPIVKLKPRVPTRLTAGDGLPGSYAE